MAWWKPWTWFDELHTPSKMLTEPPWQSSDVKAFNFASLRNLMRQKDAEFAGRLWSYSWPTAIAKWREKYPEDFVGVKGADSLASLLSADHIKL